MHCDIVKLTDKLRLQAGIVWCMGIHFFIGWSSDLKVHKIFLDVWVIYNQKNPKQHKGRIHKPVHCDLEGNKQLCFQEEVMRQEDQHKHARAQN